MSPTMMWTVFGIVVVLMMVVDLGLFHRNPHAVNIKEALGWSAVWIGLALAFNVFVYYELGPDAGLKFFTAYLVEKSLSVDNLFVFLLIFSYFKIPALYQHRVLFWGIIGAVIMRAVFIGAGIALIERFHWMIYLFGAFLLFTGIKLLFEDEKELHPEKNIVIRLFRKFMPVTHNLHEGHFFIREHGKRVATPLFIALLIVETTDVIFAVDSIPAVLGISQDPFIVYSSNIFAILGLRALYFAVAGLMRLFHYLKYGLSLIIVYVGVKMCISGYYKIPSYATLLIITGVLGTAVAISILFPPKTELKK